MDPTTMIWVVAGTLGITALLQLNLMMWRWGRSRVDQETDHKLHKALMSEWADKIAAIEKQAARQAQDAAAREQEFMQWRGVMQGWGATVSKLEIAFLHLQHQHANKAEGEDDFYGTMPATSLPGPDEDMVTFLPSVGSRSGHVRSR